MKHQKKRKRKPSYLSFQLGKENYAISSPKIIEIQKAQYITPFPNVPNFIKGVISFRGSIIPVICLRYKLNLPINDSQKYDLIICDAILNKKKIMIASMVDNVTEILSADDEEIQPIMQTSTSLNTDIFLGMLKTNEHFTSIVDIDKIFTEIEQNINEVHNL